MDGGNPDLSKNMVEKIPALDMVLTIASDGSQTSAQVGTSNPCYIMCMDVSGRLLRIPMSVLPKQTSMPTNKMNDSQDKQKAPVATIAPWITPVQISQENVASQLPETMTINHQQLTNQQLYIDQAQMSHHNPSNQQLLANQQQLTNKLLIMGPQLQQQQQQQQHIIIQQPVDKLQSLAQKQPISSPHANVKHAQTSDPQNQQCHKLALELLASRQQSAMHSNAIANQYCSSQQRPQTGQPPLQRLQSTNLQPANQFQVAQKQLAVDPSLLQKHPFQQQAAAAPQPGQLSLGVTSNVNLLAVLQNGKILQSKSQPQFQDQTSSMIQRLLSGDKVDQIHQDLMTSAREERSLQATVPQSWNNSQLLQPDANLLKQSIANAGLPFAIDKNIMVENVNGKSMLTLNNLNIHLKNLARSKVDLINRQQQFQGVPQEPTVQKRQIISSQDQFTDHQSPSKANSILNNSGNSPLKANAATFQQNNLDAQSNFLLQEIFQKEQSILAQKTEFSHDKLLAEQSKSDNFLQSQFVVLENKSSNNLQIPPPKQLAFPPMTSANVQCLTKTFTSSLVLSSPQVHFSMANLTAPHQVIHTHSQIPKTGNGLKQAANVQAIIIPNNIPVNTLQLPQITGLPLSNLSSIHIISSGSLNLNSHDQVLFLPSQTSPKLHPTIACPNNSMRQLCNLAPGSKQLQNSIVLVQNPLVKANANQVLSKQLKSQEPNDMPSAAGSFKSLGACDGQIGSSSGMGLQVDFNQQNPNVQSPSSQSEQFSVGQEYQLSYPNGVRVTAVWDGKYFKVKTPPNASLANATQIKAQIPKQEDKSNTSCSAGSSGDVTSARIPMQFQDGKAADLGHQNVQSFDGTSKRNREEGKHVLCKRCGRICPNHDKCDNCNRLFSEDTHFVVPDKKIKLTNDNNFFTQFDAQRTPLNKFPNDKRSKKIASKKSSASPKKDAEIVHILSSDDEESSWDDSGKAPNSPSSSSNAFPLSSLIPFTGFRVNIRRIFFGKISCDWLNTLTFDRKSVNLLSDTFSGSYCLSACGSEVMLVAAYFSANKHCTYLFLQVNHSSAIKLFDRVFVNSRSLYDPLSKDDCAKYVVLFLDDEQTNLIEVIPQVVESMQLCNETTHPVYKTIENFDVDAFLKSVKLSGDPVLRKESVIVSRKCQEEEGDEMHLGEQSLGAVNGKIINLFTYPPPPSMGGITVTNEDLFCLNEGEFLNDVIIDFYLKYLANELLAEKFKNSHIFSSFFYRRLTRKVPRKTDEEGFSKMTLQQRRHAHVRTWTRHVDLFSKDFIVVPINESAHWFLAIICYPGLTTIEYESKHNDGPPPEAEKLGRGKGKKSKVLSDKNCITKKMPCILVFDSLSGPSRGGVIKLLRDYLQVEWDLKKKQEFGERQFNRDTLKGTIPECPQQTNFSDCGVYVLQYVESFFTDPIADYTFPIKQLSNWFDERKVCKKRAELQQLILEMQRMHNPSLDFHPDQNGCIIKCHDANV